MNESETNTSQISEGSSLLQQLETLKSANSELVRTVQNLKITARQREDERLDLLKELNYLKFKLCRLESGGASQVQALERVIQHTIEGAVTHMVQASEAVTGLLVVVKDYLKDSHELGTKAPRWSNLSSPRTCEKAKGKVRPLSYGGRNIQPFVSLNRVTINNNNNPVSAHNRERTSTERAPMPIHVLQDLYIPLMRIDAASFLQNNEETVEGDSGEELGLPDDANNMDDDLSNMSDDDVEEQRGLDHIEEVDELQGDLSRMSRSIVDPLEGPSSLLDASYNVSLVPISTQTSEPDSTTSNLNQSPAETLSDSKLPSHSFSPTVRRRKRTSSPPSNIVSSPTLISEYSGRTVTRRCGVSMPKRSSIIEFDDEEDAGGSGEPKSSTPNEIYAVRVKEKSVPTSESERETTKPKTKASRSRTSATPVEVVNKVRKISAPKKSVAESDNVSESQSISDMSAHSSNTEETKRRSSRSLNKSTDSMESSQDEESGRPRSRRSRKQVTYKEAPLNRKMRR